MDVRAGGRDVHLLTAPDAFAARQAWVDESRGNPAFPKLGARGTIARMETTKNITAVDIDRTEQPGRIEPYRINDPRDEITHRLDTAWQRALDELFASRRAAA